MRVAEGDLDDGDNEGPDGGGVRCCEAAAEGDQVGGMDRACPPRNASSLPP